MFDGNWVELIRWTCIWFPMWKAQRNSINSQKAIYHPFSSPNTLSSRNHIALQSIRQKKRNTLSKIIWNVFSFDSLQKGTQTHVEDDCNLSDYAKVFLCLVCVCTTLRFCSKTDQIKISLFLSRFLCSSNGNNNVSWCSLCFYRIRSCIFPVYK